MKTRLPVHGSAMKSFRIPSDATVGAQIGVNLLDPNGNVVTAATWNTIVNPKPTPVTFTGTSDDVPEGQFNLYFTNARAQAAVGAILVNSANVTLTYASGVPSITADLTNVTVSGTGGALRKYAFDAKGRLSNSSAATTDDLTEGTTNLYFTKPRVAGSLIPGAGIALTTDGLGNTTIASATSVFPNLTDQASVNLTDQGGTQLTGNSIIGSITTLIPYTLATLPSAPTLIYGMIFVTDLTGGAEPCFSDGTNWRRCSDRTIAS